MSGNPVKPPPTTGGMPSSRGNGPGRSGTEQSGRFSGRGRYRGGHGGQARGSQAGYGSSLKFTRACEGLKGLIYDCNTDRATGMKPADTYVRTTQALSVYMGSTCKNGMDIKSSIDHMRRSTFALPEDLLGTASDGQKLKHKLQIEAIVKRENTLEENIGKLYSVIMGQCTELIKEKIKQTSGYIVISEAQDGLAALQLIRKISLNFEDFKYLPLATVQVKKQYFGFKQEPGTTILQYHTSFLNMRNAFKNCEACSGIDTGVVNWMIIKVHGIGETVDTITYDELLTIQACAEEQEAALIFLYGADKGKYAALWEELENACLGGQNNFPSTVDAAYTRLVNWTNIARSQPRSFGPAADGANFANRGIRNDAKAPPRDKSHITCFNCGEMGHYANECKKEVPKVKDVSGEQHVTKGTDFDDSDDEDINFIFVSNGLVAEGVQLVSEQRKKYASIPTTWVLLDSQSTMDVFCNPRLVQNIHKATHRMNIHCTAGMTSTDLIADLPGYGTVWFHPKGIANILSLSRVKERHKVTYDSTDGNAFLVHRPDGTTRRFEESDHGLYFSNAGITGSGTILVSMVETNRSNYSDEAYSRALAARQIQRTIGRPSTKDFIRYIDDGHLPGCPINRHDIQAAEHIFGPDIGALKGKTTRKTPSRVITPMLAVPVDLMTQYQHVTISADIMFVNKVAIFITVSHGIRFGTAEMIQNRKTSTFVECM